MEDCFISINNWQRYFGKNTKILSLNVQNVNSKIPFPIGFWMNVVVFHYEIEKHLKKILK